MRQQSQHRWGFHTARRAAEAFCFYVMVGLTASAIGFVGAVLVLTAPKRTTLINASLPAVSWDLRR